jgi:hypothetical protein
MIENKPQSGKQVSNPELSTTKQERWSLAIVVFFKSHILEAVDTILCSLLKVNRRFRSTKLSFASCLLQADFFALLTLQL